MGKTRRSTRLPTIGAVALIAAATLLGPTAAQNFGPVGFELPWTTIDGGGGFSSSASFDLFATVGQPDASQTVMSSALFDLQGGFWYARLSDTTCPDGPDNLLKTFGRIVEGDTTLLCASDDVRIEIVNNFPVTPLLPFIRFEFWAHSTVAGDSVASVSYLVEGHCTAIVSGGQNGNTLQTRIRNYSTGIFELIDVRPTGPFDDELIEHTQLSNAPNYVQAANGEVRVRMEAFNPGVAINAAWAVQVDAFEVTVSQ